MDEKLADYENAHAALDMLGVPREEDGRVFTLHDRVGRLSRRLISLKLQMAAMGACLRWIDTACGKVSFPCPPSDLYALVKSIRGQIAESRAYVKERAAKDKTGPFRPQPVEDFVPPSQQAKTKTAPAQGRQTRLFNKGA